ncbi:MAG: phage holin family protein [Candidatus Heimdallarchaeota archaeon]
MITETVFHYLNTQYKFLYSKILIALFPTGFFIITDTHREVLAIVLWLLIIDTFLGLSVAVKYKKVSSSRMIKAVKKFILYIVALATAYLIGCLDIPVVGYTYLYVGSFLATTEAISNFEKLSLLGLKLPKQLLSRLNDNFQDIDRIRDDWINKK